MFAHELANLTIHAKTSGLYVREYYISSKNSFNLTDSYLIIKSKAERISRTEILKDLDKVRFAPQTLMREKLADLI